KGLVSSAGYDRNPQLWICRELIEDIRQLLVRHRVEGVCDLGSIYCNDQQMTVGLDLAVLAHGVLLPQALWDRRWHCPRAPSAEPHPGQCLPAIPARCLAHPTPIARGQGSATLRPRLAAPASWLWRRHRLGDRLGATSIRCWRAFGDAGQRRRSAPALI